MSTIGINKLLFLSYANMGILKDFLPGIIGGILNTYAGHPFDTVRVRMQNINNRHNGFMDCFRKTYKHEGIRGIYKGATVSTLGLMAENSIVFAVNENLKKRLHNVNGKQSLQLHQDMVFGSLSGLAASITSCPFEAVKCNMQVSEKKHSWSDILKNDRSKMYNGFGATCFRTIPYYLFFFPIYTRCIDLMSSITKRSKAKQNIIDYSIAGGLSGATTWGIVYPMDVIKCNQQLNRDKTSIVSMAKLLYKNKGFKGFYSGFTPTILRSFPANAGLIFGIEATNSILNSKNS